MVLIAGWADSVTFSLPETLKIAIEAAMQRGEPIDHVLLHGPPGLGKTTLAHIIANEMGVNLRQTSGPVLERPGDLAALLTNLEPHDVLFVDEIHRLSPVVEEVLYPAMEDYQLDIVIGEGPAARSIKLDTLLEELMPPGREAIPFSKMALVLIICRLCHPSSELYIAEHYYDKTALPDLLGIAVSLCLPLIIVWQIQQLNA